jgi:hypothetical protein
MARLEDMAVDHPNFAHMAAVAASVVLSESTDLLAGCTSMHDLIVVPTPIPEPPYDVIAVRAPGSLANPPAGQVIVEHLSCTGHNDRIARPTSEAVPLFWRFVAEKYGVHPRRPPAPS